MIPRRVTGSYQYGPPVAPAAARAPSSAYGGRVGPSPPPPVPLTQQANQAVNQQLAPQFASQEAYAARQNAAITQFAQALMGKLTPIAGQVGQDYDQAIQQTGQLSGAAAQYLSNANPSGQVADLLHSAGAPQAQIDQQTAQLGQAYGGAAGVLSFLGGAVPGGQLAETKAAAQTEAAQLPGFAALRGQQDLAAALSQQGLDRQKLEATRPGLYQSALSDLGTQQYHQQQLGLQQQQIDQTARGQAATAGYHAANLRETTRAHLASERQGQIKEIDRVTQQRITSLIAEGFDPATGKLTPKAQAEIDRITTSAEAAKQRLAQSGERLGETRRHNLAMENKPPKPPANVVRGSDKTGRYLIDPTTGRRIATITQPIPGSSSTTKLPTANQASTLVDQWKGGKVKNVRVPVLDSNGKPVLNDLTNVPQYVSKSVRSGQLTYGQAYKRFIAMGLPDKKARQYLSSGYKRGEQGRAWLTNEEQFALGHAKQPTQASVMKGHGVLRPGQVKALRKAGKLPPGQLTAEGAYVIAQGYS